MTVKTQKPRQRLKEVREAKGTQREVAIELGITETHLREIENGRSVPGTKLLKRIEHYFGVSDDELFPDLNEPEFYLN
ncbi:helix-turn-helix transcriptional regulator [Brevibacillus agri]|uniref:helix-turn-helix domain-containing protein n=1 Tax=Brevibacillus agri TaxID=51101 RepID=UPI002E22AA52|nr:helix-turn-helix transcriptional regulator [Brevibacillus agri]MED1654455.1 helix-turn-helix transcriptional regulator [Brevibacillus agri]MED1688138.1 helix-turn-helix transcriptional regulator [Brevibacillus agri]MED1691132.1 helix-turn-helix transcriptional regulator [Brevibacillus agri]MED1699368.1 helix-turn-helix transcriptional regulator [Brevibacillus agri]